MNTNIKAISFHQGQAMLIATIFFFIGSLILLGGIAAPTLREIVMLRDLNASKQSLMYAEGAAEDVVYRLLHAMEVDTTEVVPFLSGVATATTATTINGKEVDSRGDQGDAIRKTRTVLLEGVGVSFNYGMQSDTGGIILENSSSVLGNVYSNGSIDGSGSNLIAGDVVSAGVSGLVDGVHATGSAYANRIQDSLVDEDAYYQSIASTIVLGTQFPGSANQVTAPLPIDDAMIADWEAGAAAGGTYAGVCPYVVTTNVSLGPVKINCDLEIKNSAVITLYGDVWVAGDITFSNTPTVRIDASLGNKSLALIADDPSNRLSGSQIDISNSTTFQGSGSDNSYVMLISQNTSASTGGTNYAIRVQNSANGDILVYAAHGEISVENNTSLREVTAYRIRLKNAAQIIYETGLASMLFTGGPGGGWNLDRWSEID